MIKKRKLKILLSDLTHTGIRISNDFFPLNIGLVASYALKKFGNDIEIKLFKYPEKLLYALENDTYDVLGGSAYIWNDNLTEWGFEVAKRYNPRVLTVRGGPNFPLLEREQKEYLLKHKYTDVYCFYEGEVAFANVIERLLNVGGMEKWSANPLAGSCFLDKRNGKKLVKGDILPRISALDEIPSPYTSGLLDEFFDGKLCPLIATNRGCPFTCNYCNSSNIYYSKINFFPPEYINKEINYIAKKISIHGISNLTMADNNFGMFPSDKKIAMAIKTVQKKYKWPLSIIVSTGKTNLALVKEVADILGNMLTITMSLQSLNSNTLKIIGRSNIDPMIYYKIATLLEERKQPRLTELIAPLPGETLESYMEGIKKLFEMGANGIVSYTLLLNNGTIYTDLEYTKKYRYKVKYRLIPNSFGTYGGKKTFDCDRVASSTKSLSFKDYLELRKFTLIIEILFNNSICRELLKFMNQNDIDTYSFFKYLLDELPRSLKGVKKVIRSFVSDTTHELKDTQRDLIAYYSTNINYEKLKTGQIGGNVVYKHKGMMLGRYMKPWIDYVMSCAFYLLKRKNIDNNPDELMDMLDALHVFIMAKLDRLFAFDKSTKAVDLNFKYDIVSWLNDKKEMPLSGFKTKRKLFAYRFYFDKNQKIERNDLFSRYKEDTSGLSKVMARLMSLEHLFRKVKKIKA